MPCVDYRLQLDGLLHLHPVGHINKHPVGVVVAVQLQVRVLFRAALAEILSHKLRPLAADLAQTATGHPLGIHAQSLMAISVLHHQAVGLEVGDIAAVFSRLAFALRQAQLVRQQCREVHVAPHLVLPHTGLDIA